MASLEQLRDEFIAGITWSDKATDEQKQLVNGNIKAFAQFMSGRPVQLAPALKDRLIQVAVDEYSLTPALENADDQLGRHSAVRGVMVRLGLYPQFVEALNLPIEEIVEKAFVETLTKEPTGGNETTSPEIASLAARGLHNPENLTREEVRRICASALTQYPSDPESATMDRAQRYNALLDRARLNPQT